MLEKKHLDSTWKSILHFKTNLEMLSCKHFISFLITAELLTTPCILSHAFPDSFNPVNNIATSNRCLVRAPYLTWLFRIPTILSLISHTIDDNCLHTDPPRGESNQIKFEFKLVFSQKTTNGKMFTIE